MSNCRIWRRGRAEFAGFVESQNRFHSYGCGSQRPGFLHRELNFCWFLKSVRTSNGSVNGSFRRLIESGDDAWCRFAFYQTERRQRPRSRPHCRRLTGELRQIGLLNPANLLAPGELVAAAASGAGKNPPLRRQRKFSDIDSSFVTVALSVGFRRGRIFFDRPGRKGG